MLERHLVHRLAKPQLSRHIDTSTRTEPAPSPDCQLQIRVFSVRFLPKFEFQSFMLHASGRGSSCHLNVTRPQDTARLERQEPEQLVHHRDLCMLLLLLLPRPVADASMD